MGRIIEIKRPKDGKVIVEVEMDYDEHLKLVGAMKDVYLFSEKTLDVETRFCKRGTKSLTKSILFPKQIKYGLTFNEKILCKRFDSESKIIFISIIDKENMCKP